MSIKPRTKPLHAVTIHIVQDIIDYIEDNILEPLTPERIAGQFYLSVSALNGLFKIVCDIAVMEYVRNRRLTLAGRELLTSNIRVIDLALQYGYETPEAFTKAFARFHGFPPSLCRRIHPRIKAYSALRVELRICGGWEPDGARTATLAATDPKAAGQANPGAGGYTEAIPIQGGIRMAAETGKTAYNLRVQDMEYKEQWRILLALAKKLDDSGISFKVDGRTMVFAHGLEFKLEKICLTFKWDEEQRILDFFGHEGRAKPYSTGFKYFDAGFEGMKIRCMFYGDCPGDDTDDFLYRNTDSVQADGQRLRVQSLEFYYENADPNDECYPMVERWLNR